MSRVLSLAGFEVTLIGRFWMIPEDRRCVYVEAVHCRLSERTLSRKRLAASTLRSVVVS